MQIIYSMVGLLSSQPQTTHHSSRSRVKSSGSKIPSIPRGHLRGLTVAWWITYHYHSCSNLGVGISEVCFILDFDLLPLAVARPIQPTMCTNVAVKSSIIIIIIIVLVFPESVAGLLRVLQIHLISFIVRHYIVSG